MKIFLLIFLSILFSVFSISAQKKISLSFQPPLHTIFETDYTTESKITQIYMGIEQSTEMKTSVKMWSQVLGKSEDEYKIEYQYKKLKIDVSSPVFQLSMNSNDTVKSTQNRLIKGMINKSFYVFVNQQGNISRIDGLDEIINSIGNDLSIDINIKNSFIENIDNSFGKSYFENSFQYAFLKFPEEKIREGDSWKYSSSIASNLSNLSVTNHAKLINIEKKQLIINLTSRIDTPNPAFNKGDEVEQKVELKGSGNTKINLSRELTLPFESHSNQKTSGTILIKINDESQEIIEIPLTITTQSEMKIKFEN